MEKVIEVEADLALFATMLWTVWYRRNVIRTSNRLFPIQCIMQEVRSTRTAFLRSVASRRRERVTNTRHNLRWELPPWPNLKVNFDGAVFREENHAGEGVIIRDWNGQVVASMAETFPLPSSVTAMEVVAATKALRFAKELGLLSVVLKGDSKIIVDALASENPSLTEYRHLIDEAKELANDFTYIEFSHVLRQKNSAAHNITKYTRHVSEYSMWMEGILLHLFSIIQADSASI